MQKTLIIGLTLAAFFLDGSRVRADEVWYTDLNQARKVAEETNRPILCHFYADWCGPCQQMERRVFPLRQVRQQLSTAVVAVKINVTKSSHLSNRFGVTSLPTDIFLEPNGQEILKSTGFRSSNEYVRLMMRARTRYADLLATREAVKSKRIRNSLAGKNPSVIPAAATEVMLGGYCPVDLWRSRRWEKGALQFQAEHKGQSYQFASAENLDKFKQTPDRYVPQFLGCDPVVVWETDRAVSGKIQFGAFYDERLYLFTNDQNRKRFKAAPDQFIKTQVVLHSEQIERVVR